MFMGQVVKWYAIRLSNSGAYPQTTEVYWGIFTMKKFKINEPSIMQIEREGEEMAQSTHQNLINSSQRQHWNDKVPKGGKIIIGVMYCLRVSPIELMIP